MKGVPTIHVTLPVRKLVSRFLHYPGFMSGVRQVVRYTGPRQTWVKLFFHVSLWLIRSTRDWVKWRTWLRCTWKRVRVVFRKVYTDMGTDLKRNKRNRVASIKLNSAENSPFGLQILTHPVTRIPIIRK